MTTVAPRRANLAAAASPMPDDAPVSTMRFPARSTSPWPDNRSIRGGRMPASSRLSLTRCSGLLLTP
ncbi:Uncharacterised protein [Mycobacteroides abscessus subsp. abscessus]|nr:Uncharacterised protein [Mycobacteroides abscessus subsp. abscessus]